MKKANVEKIFKIENERVVVNRDDGDTLPLSHEMSQNTDDGTYRDMLNVTPHFYRWGPGWSVSQCESLARAILYEVTGDAPLSVKYGREFSEERIIHWEDEQDISGVEIRAWLQNKGAKINVL